MQAYRFSVWQSFEKIGAETEESVWKKLDVRYKKYNGPMAVFCYTDSDHNKQLYNLGVKSWSYMSNIANST